MSTANHKLRVFLCHASEDKPIVRKLYKKLFAERWIDPWLDEEKLLPGQNFDLEINKATRDADVIIICLSNDSVMKEGYVNREIRRALDIAEEKLEGEIFIIPLRLDDCAPPFEQLKKLHWVDYFENNGYEKLIKSLVQRFERLGRKIQTSTSLPDDLYKFVYFPAGQIPETKQFSAYPFWISKYPVTNLQYERFLKDPYFDPKIGLMYKGEDGWDNRNYWGYIPTFEKNRSESKRTDLDSGTAGLKWIEERLSSFRPWYNSDGKEYMILSGGNDPEGRRVLYPRYWNNPDFGITRKNAPVVGVTWYEASAYCKWLEKNWNNLEESEVNKEITWPSQIWIRLPTRNEWEVAAGGKFPNNRYPWDKFKESTSDIREIFNRANVAFQVGKTTPVDKYLAGASPRGVMDMSGNVWEWLSNIFQPGENIVRAASLDVPEDIVPSYHIMEMIGGAWSKPENDANLSGRNVAMPDEKANDIGFRVAIAKM